MKRFGVVLLVLVMALAALASLAGCGSKNENKDKAKGYMNAGDAQYNEAVKAFEKLSEIQTQLVTAKGEALNTLVAELQVKGAEMTALFAAAKVEYDKILPLTGVEDYVTYANLQNDVIAMYGDLMAAGTAMITTYLPQIQTGTLDVMALLGGPEFKKITTIGDDIEVQETKNKNFKSEKKLAQ